MDITISKQELIEAILTYTGPLEEDEYNINELRINSRKNQASTLNIIQSKANAISKPFTKELYRVFKLKPAL